MAALDPAPLLVSRLEKSGGAALFPLMRQLAPTLNLRDWLRYSRRIAAAGAEAREGVLVARRAGVPHPCGALCYRRHGDMRFGRVITAEHCIAMDLLYPEAVLAALLLALETLAARQGCGAIRALVPQGRGSALADLQALGHTLDGALLIKELPGLR